MAKNFFTIFLATYAWLTFTCSESAIKTLEKDMKYVPS